MSLKHEERFPAAVLVRTVLVWALLIGFGAGCSQKSSTERLFGKEVDAAQMKDSATSFESFRSAGEGHEVVLAGKIGKVCPAGCWFYLEGESDICYVDVLGDFEIPPDASGHRAWVKGTVSGTGGARILQGIQVVVAPAN